MTVIQFHRPRRQIKTPAVHTNYVGFVLSDELLAGLENVALHEKVTRSEIIRRAVEAFLKGKTK
jgi:metal-responsive CopG/Arc/MetJ family transcriptional regulator